MACSCLEGGGPPRRPPRRGRWPRWPELPLPALLLLLVSISVPTSPAPFQGDPAPGRSPGPPGPTASPTSPPGPPRPAATMSTTGVTRPAEAPVQAEAPVASAMTSRASVEPEPPWCDGYAARQGAALDSPPQHAINLSLSHGLYQPAYGLVRNIKYRVWVQAPLAAVHDFSLWASTGSWLGSYSSGPCRTGPTVAAAQGAGAGGGAGALAVGEAVFHWMAQETSESEITFRLRYRLVTEPQQVYQKEMHVLMRQDCALWLWPSWGDLSWLDLPQPADCVVWFPARSLHEQDAILVAGRAPPPLPPSAGANESNDIRRQHHRARRARRQAEAEGAGAAGAAGAAAATARTLRAGTDSRDDQLVDGDDVLREGRQQDGQRAMGLLVDLMRLNVACSSGGWLHIGDPQDSGLPPPGRLCGKLEELSAAQRRLHFPTPPALHVHGQLVFALRYRLVDYCHQVALVQSNASVPLAASPGLTCTFSVTLPHGYHVNMRLLAGEPVPGTPVDVVDINTPSGGSSSENADEKEGEVREAPVEDNVEIVSTDVDLISHVTELPQSVSSAGASSSASAATASGTAAAAGPATSTATTTSYYRSSAQRGPTAASSSTRPKRPRARRDGPGQPPTSPTRPPTAPPQARPTALPTAPPTTATTAAPASGPDSPPLALPLGAPQRPTPSSARVAEFLRDAMLREHRPPGPLASTAAAPSAAPTSTFSSTSLSTLHELAQVEAQALLLTRRLALHEENFAATSSSSSSSSEESSEEDEEAANATRAVRGRMRRNYNDVILEEDALASPSPSSPSECAGTWLNLTDGLSTWTHCAAPDHRAKVFRFLSARNMLQLTVRMGGLAVPLRLDYDARPVRRVVQGCAFGWVAVGQFCVTAVEDFRLGWADAETECRRRGGHLASIPDQEAQRAIDDLLTNSPGYSDHNSYWVGASDVTNEGDFRWTDSLPFSYTNWFPGWTQHGGYNRQPNDDGFSAQDCVELRRAFLLPPSPAAAALTKALPLDSSFRWNDRDCSTRNHFLCERPRDAQYPGGDHWSTGDCTRTVTLTRESLRAVLTSPGFPRAYPNDAQCDTDIVAPPGHRLVLDFEEFVLEKEPYCSYDYLTIREDIFEEAHKNVTNTSLHAGLGPPGHPNLTAATPTAAGHPELSHLGMEGHVLVGRGHHRYCGDWSEKLKLLRYTSRGPRLRLRFHSDYSHHFGGFKARVSAETAMECPDPRQYSFNSSCFLVVSFPQVTWQTARQVCEGLKTEMAEVFSSAEQDFVVDRIRHSHDYSTSNTYWLGGLLRLEGRWEWLSGQPMAFTGWIPPPSSLPDPVSEEPQDSVDSSLPSSCLALQWRSHNNKQLPSALPSGMYWAPRKCTAVGGYVCRTAQVPVLDLSKHLNVTQTEPGTLSSPGYPSGYPANLDYQVRLVGPPQSRVVVRFARVDLEAQAQCLYDFIELSDARAGARQGRRKIICGQHHSAAAMERFDFVSSSNEAVLRFRSDYSVAGAGFLGSWTAVDVSGCPQQTLSAREGELTSPFYPHKLLPDLQCTAIVRAPAGRRVWLEFTDVDMGGESTMWVDLGAGRKVVPTASPVSGGVLLSAGERLDVVLSTSGIPRGKGFRATYRAMSQDAEEVVVHVKANDTTIPIRHLNFPAPPPVHVNFLLRFIAPLGARLQLQLYGVALARSASTASCPGGAGHLEVRDSYADNNGSTWILCEAPDASTAPFVITSYLNTLQLWQRGQESGVTLNATIQPIRDEDYRVKLVRMSNASWSVESCSPNPCQNDGKCLVRDRRRVCECKGHFTGLLCGLTECDLEPCVWGKCILTPGSFRCACAPHYKGALCNVRAKPCNDNPCEGRGECHEKGDTFHCRCHAWWEGPKCERRMSVPFKPLSERMLQEPFWLGLITVTAVLGVIGLFWCAKRHFPEKLEKLLAEEADRNRSGGIYPSRGSSLRDQLHAGPGASHSLAASTASASGTSGGRGDVGGGPGGSGGGGGGGSRDGTGPQPPRSLLGRLGIRKPSILSLTATAASPAETGATARTFSLDDLLRPPPGRTPSPRKKRNNSTPTRQRSAADAAEKKQILQQLVSGTSLDGEPLLLDSLGDSNVNNNNKAMSRTPSVKGSRDEDGITCETSFSVGHQSHGSEPPHKLEKKVTFARLLNKVSAEMSSGSETGRPPDASGAGGGPGAGPAGPDGLGSQHSPPHSTSSNPGTGTGSDSLSSLDASAGGDVVVHRRPTRLLNLLRYCDQELEDAVTSDDSSHQTPATSSSGAPDSPPLPRSVTTTPTPTSTPTSSTIEVTVLDPLSACQQRGSSGAVILLEVPCSGSRNLSPIREVPTPRPTPLPTPLPSPMPTPAPSPILPRSPVGLGLLTPVPYKGSGSSATSPSPSAPTTTTSPTSTSLCSLSPSPNAATLVIPELRVEQPSPTRSPSVPSWSFHPGSPPPQRLPSNRPHDVDVLPFITVTCSTSEAESDVEGHGLAAGTSTSDSTPGMCYLSPFSMCSRADRIASESNLSSSGYSSMASPGASRCGSSNPLSMSASEVEVFQAETEDGSPGSTAVLPRLGLGLGLGLGQRSLLLRSPGSPGTCVAQPPPTRRASEGTAVDAVFYPTLRRPMRGRSDSETLSDDAVMESQDEGFATDTRQSLGALQPGGGADADAQPVAPPRRARHCGSLDLGRGAPLPLGMTHLLLPAISIAEPTEEDTLLPPAPSTVFLAPATELDDVSVDMCADLEAPITSLLTLPSIVVEGDQGDAVRSLSPVSGVSSRSESPLSDLPAGCERFSPAFYGRQLPFTDSDGLYDAPSSAGSATAATRKSASGRRRERRSPTARSAARSPPPPKLLLDVPEGGPMGGREHRAHSSPRKPSPKRRARNAKVAQPPSSSSDESLNSIREVCQRPTSPAVSERLAWVRTPEQCSHPSTEASGEETGEDAKSHSLRGKQAWEDSPASPLSSKPNRKISRLKTIGHQIRFLRRLEKSLSRRRQRMSGSTSPCDSQDSGDDGGATTPLLPPAPSLPVVVPAGGLSSPGGAAPAAAAAPTTAGLRPRHLRFRQQKQVSAEPLLVPRDRMTRSVTIVPTAGAASAEHQASRTKPRHTD